MSHRSLKRVLGERNLERKSFLAFVICLVLLIGTSFTAVDMLAGRLLQRMTRQMGRHWSNIAIFRIHWEVWDTDSKFSPFRQKMVDQLEPQGSRAELLALDDVEWTNLQSSPPEDDEERELLVRLEKRWRERLGSDLEPPAAEPTELSLGRENDHGIFEERSVHGDYLYYEPINLRGVCLHCHMPPSSGALPAAEQTAVAGASPIPFRATRVVVPYEEARRAMENTRAILAVVAIATIFFGMLCLYVIVRYVIVKPLHHLREVSEAVSRGNQDVRANIQTNDEFEDLADSFNRMLHHLVDTQAALQQVNRELDAKVDELAQLNMRLYEMNRLKDDFLANMSHELRTPLNSIIGFSEVLQDIDSLNDKQKRYARNIQKSGRLLLEMINDILDLAKIEAGKLEVRPTEFRVDGVIHGQCDMVRSLTEEKNIDLHVDVENHLPNIEQDQAKLQQILTNLLSNAIKFTPQGGRITVAARRDVEGRLDLTVTDTGVGIREEDREIIFEKFRQSSAVFGADGMTREFSGTGLGLSIVKELCKLLGGEVTFESELGKGSTFKVVLPWIVEQRSSLRLALDARLEELSRASASSATAGSTIPRAGERDAAATLALTPP